jgi:hypothetical protein
MLGYSVVCVNTRKSVANLHLNFMFWSVLPTLAHVPFVAIVTERIIINNYSYNKICDEQMIDMLFTVECN